MSEVEKFKEEVVSKVRELNNCLTGYKSKYKELTVLFTQEEYKNLSQEIKYGGLLVEFNEKPTLNQVTLSSSDK